MIVEWALSKFKKLQLKSEKDREMAEKYPAFKRNDLHKVSRPILYLLAPLTFLRFMVGWGSIVMLYIYIKIILWGHKKGVPISESMRQWVAGACRLSARMVILMMSGVHIS